MFESPFTQKSNNSLFSSPFQTQSSEERLNQLIQEMEMIKGKNQPKRTVFTDISDEMKDLSEDEKRFIESSKEYIEASAKYQNDFSMFLVQYLGDEFTRSEFGKSPEQILAIIKKKKEEYKNHFAENISEIRDQNNNLALKNDELAKTNLELQKQLAEIKKQLGGLK
jgi:transposase-like protein